MPKTRSREDANDIRVAKARVKDRRYSLESVMRRFRIPKRRRPAK